MSEKKINQCLFDFVNFYAKKSHLLFPGTLAFPQFFAISIRSISYNLNESEDFKTLCLSYCQILQTIINRVFDKQKYNKIIINCNKLKDAVITRKNIETFDFILLESYLNDNDGSIDNYRNALLNETLNYYNFENIEDYIHHLYERECCTSEEKMTISPPPFSKHYLIFPPQLSNTSFNFDAIFLTTGWGPFYWNIFHSVGKGKERGGENEDLLKFIYVFPMTVPCNQCRDNYLNKVKYFEQEYFYNNNNKVIDIQKIYEKIHDEVNYEKIIM